MNDANETTILSAHYGQLKKCVWGGCVYAMFDERSIVNPESPRLGVKDEMRSQC